jgi:hypothetical protein
VVFIFCFAFCIFFEALLLHETCCIVWHYCYTHLIGFCSRHVGIIARRKLKVHNSVGIALGYRLDDRGSSVRFPAGAGNFSLHHRVQNGSGTTEHPVQWIPGALSLGVKRPGREAIPPPSQYTFMALAQGQLYLTLPFIKSV